MGRGDGDEGGHAIAIAVPTLTFGFDRCEGFREAEGRYFVGSSVAETSVVGRGRAGFAVDEEGGFVTLAGEGRGGGGLGVLGALGVLDVLAVALATRSGY